MSTPYREFRTTAAAVRNDIAATRPCAVMKQPAGPMIGLAHEAHTEPRPAWQLLAQQHYGVPLQRRAHARCTPGKHAVQSLLSTDEPAVSARYEKRCLLLVDYSRRGPSRLVITILSNASVTRCRLHLQLAYISAFGRH